VLYGHTHVPALESRGGVLWLNPGHLKGPVDKGHPPTFALLRLSSRRLSVEIRRLENGKAVMRA
jgi:predicted phosphodiesterase